MAQTRSNTWSDEELQLLREFYPTKGWEIPELLKTRSRTAIITAASLTGIKASEKPRRQTTTPVPVEINGVPYPSISSACKAHGLSSSAISKLCYEKSISAQEAILRCLTEPGAHQRWTSEEDALLRKHYPTMGYSVTELFPTRTEKSIRNRVVRLGLRQESSPDKWTVAEDNLLRNSWGSSSREEVDALFPGKTYPAIARHAATLKITKHTAMSLCKAVEDIMCCTELEGGLLYVACKCGKHVIVPISDAVNFSCPQHCGMRVTPSGWYVPEFIKRRLKYLGVESSK